MKIAHVASEFFPAIGGVGQVVRELATRQVKAGHEVHVFAPDWDKEKRIEKKHEVIEGVHIHRCFHLAKMGNFSTLWPGVFPKLIKGKFDIIHSHLFAHPHFVLSGLAARITGAKHVHTTHCPWSDAYRSTLGRMGIFISYNLVSNIIAHTATDAFITITDWEKRFLPRFGGHPKKTITIPNGMADIFFTNIKKNQFKKKHGIKGNFVLFFGRLNETKRPDNFVRIAKKVLVRNKTVTFVIRGPDEGMREKVKELIGKEKRIILLPETRDRKEIAEMYQAADMYVLPSYREGLPLTLFEAMASGLPIVASPVNGVPFEMKDPENGFLIPWHDLDIFAKKIEELLKNKKLRKKIGKHNRIYAQKYNWDGIEKRTMNVYQAVLKGKSITQT